MKREYKLFQKHSVKNLCAPYVFQFLLSLWFGLFLIGISVGNLQGQTLKIANAEYAGFYNNEHPLVFAWSDTLSAYDSYTFKIFSLNQGQSISDALNQNRPIYTQSHIEPDYFVYPWNAPKLQRGNYVVALYSSTLIASDVVEIGYAVDLPIPPHILIPLAENYYATLKESLDGGYQIAYDKILLFHYTRLYSDASSQLLFRITDMYGNILVETDSLGNIPSMYVVQSVPLPHRENYISVNLTSCPGIEMRAFYLLTVWNEKKEHYFLRFQCMQKLSIAPLSEN